MPKRRGCKCGAALQHAIMTSPDKIPAATRQRLDLLVGKYLQQSKVGA
jgi:5'-methylthioadenosine phosphorylase